jgi:hypothetical protein
MHNITLMNKNQPNIHIIKLLKRAPVVHRLTHPLFYKRFDRTLVALHDHYQRTSVTVSFFRCFDLLGDSCDQVIAFKTMNVNPMAITTTGSFCPDIFRLFAVLNFVR